MMRWSILLCVPMLAACGPRMKAEAIAGRTILVTNNSDAALRLDRLVVNGAQDRAECVTAPGVRLEAGASFTHTFFDCDDAREVVLYTDQGRTTVAFD